MNLGDLTRGPTSAVERIVGWLATLIAAGPVDHQAFGALNAAYGLQLIPTAPPRSPLNTAWSPPGPGDPPVSCQ